MQLSSKLETTFLEFYKELNNNFNKKFLIWREDWGRKNNAWLQDSF